MANTDLELTTIIKVNPVMIKTTVKALSSSIKASSAVKKMVGKRVATTSKINPIISRVTGKRLTPITKINPVIGKHIEKTINTIIKVSTTKEINSATLTMIYNGNAELGLGAQEGAQFNIIATGTFTFFTITMNGKTLTYTENCTNQTITIDNVNATVKNGTTNKLSKVTGDVADFLKLIPGNNVIVYSKAGGKIDFKFDFRPQFI